MTGNRVIPKHLFSCGLGNHWMTSRDRSNWSLVHGFASRLIVARRLRLCLVWGPEQVFDEFN
jgi:hypothetical protein